MNKDNAKEFLPLVQALAEGKVVEHKNAWGEWEVLAFYSFNDAPSSYRIRPEPRTVPWDCPEDVPMPGPCWLREGPDDKDPALITGVFPGGVKLCYYNYEWRSISTWQYSLDGKTWLPCTKTIS